MPALLSVSAADRAGWHSLRFPFNRALVDLVKSVPGSKWVPEQKCWRISDHGLAVLGPVVQKAGLGVLHQPAPRDLVCPPLYLKPGKTLRPYQLTGYARAVSRTGYALTFDPRVGKTPTAIAAAAYQLAERKAERIIVVYPASVLEEWERQLDDWAALTLTPVEGLKQPDEDQVLEWASTPWLVLGCHYEILGSKAPSEPSEKDGPQGLLKLAEQGPFSIIADEIQNAKNRKAPRTKVLHQLSAHKNCVMRLALTGTPMRNRPRDLWSMFEFLQPGSAGGYWAFAKRYCNPPEAPIWMGDYSFKPLGEIRVGDEVIGWCKKPGNRAAEDTTVLHDVLCRAKVTAVQTRTAPIVKVTFASGRQLRCTPDHLWRANNHMKPFRDSPRNTEIRKRRENGESCASIGDSFGLSVQTISNICTRKHIEYLPAKVGRKLMHVVDTNVQYPPREHWWLAGWLAGMYDGEGHRAMISQSSIANPETWARLGEAATALDIPHSLRRDIGPENAGGLQITNGWRGFLKFIQMCNPRRRSGWDKILLCGHFKRPDEVVSIEPDGFGPVISMTTETGNYVAWGFASKNCAAFEGGYGWVDEGSSNEEELNVRLSVVSYRLRREDVAAYLPKSDRKVILCNMPSDVATEYNTAAKVLVGSGVLAGALQDAEPSGASVKALEQLSSITTKAKTTTIAERVRFHAVERGVKVLVFANFHDSLRQVWDVLDPDLESGMEASGGKTPIKPLGAIPVFCAGGWMTPDKRFKVREQWKLCPGPAVLLANTLSSGIGIDLSEADVAIFAELCWVPADFSQAESRIIDIHLGKRVSPPLFEYVLARNTIDADMGLALIEKVQTIDAVVGRDAALSGMAATLRTSGVVDQSTIALNKADPAAVVAAISRLRDRLLGRAVSAASAEVAARTSLAVGLDEAIDDPQQSESEDDI